MIKRLYSSKVNKKDYFNRLFFDKIKNKNNAGIPIVVLDLQTNKLTQYKSINEAARSLAAHPKSIWRKIHNKQLYLERYVIKIHHSIYNRIFFNVIKYANTKFKFLYNNYVIVINILLNIVLLGYLVYKCTPYFIELFAYVYNNYTNVDKIDNDKLKYVLDKKCTKSNYIFNYIAMPISNEINGLVEFNQEWKSVCVLKNKTSFIHNLPHKFEIGLYQSIVNEINLDFQTKTVSFPTLNSSPILEKVNINNIFSNAIESTRPTISIVDNANPNNSLVIQTQNLHRKFSIVDNLLIGPGSPRRELLNYNSNVLFCLINGLSPSTY